MSLHARRKKKRPDDAALRALGYVREVHCPNRSCDAHIQPDHYWIDPFDKTPRCGELTIYCENCKSITRIGVVFENGNWQAVGTVEYIETHAERKAIIARAEEHSVIQVNAA